MINDIRTIQSKNPEELAQLVLRDFYSASMQIPVNPFKLLHDYGIIYQFREFQNLEGIYLVPEDEEDIPIVGINVKRPITRQRFTAAHELCHHIKDRNNQVCPIKGRKSKVELFADKFAAEILMPKEIFSEYASQFLEDGYVSFDNALLISDYFGVSFQSCIYRLAYTLKLIDGDIDSTSLAKRIQRFHPNKRKENLGIEVANVQLYHHIVDDYTYTLNQANFEWYRFKNDFVFNENRIEQLDVSEEQVAEIVTDLRMRKKDSKYCNSGYTSYIEVAGHSDMYDYIATTNDPITSFSLLHLNQIFYRYSPHPEFGGSFRTTNNLVLDSKFETLDYSQVPKEIQKLNDPIQRALADENMKVSEFIHACALIHHRITVIHPFLDGNGRVSRAFLNWMFFRKGLSPIYIKVEQKKEYFMGLRAIDLYDDPASLCKILIEQLLLSQARLAKTD